MVLLQGGADKTGIDLAQHLIKIFREQNVSSLYVIFIQQFQEGAYEANLLGDRPRQRFADIGRGDIKIKP